MFVNAVLALRRRLGGGQELFEPSPVASMRYPTGYVLWWDVGDRRHGGKDIHIPPPPPQTLFFLGTV